MTLIVETGTGASNSESYISVADASTRHTAQGNAAWAAAASDTVREQALRRATAAMEQFYRTRWSGDRVTSTQALSWPRYGVELDGFPVAANIVPADVANACADLALRALSEDLNADTERAIVREKTGPLETEWDRYAPQNKRFTAVDQMLLAYLAGGGAMARLVRA